MANQILAEILKKDTSTKLQQTLQSKLEKAKEANQKHAEITTQIQYRLLEQLQKLQKDSS